MLVGFFDSQTVRTVECVVACVNASLSPNKLYEISPVDLLQIQREARFAGRQVVGFYHSHPDRSAHWSTTDLDEAHWTGCSYVIISVENGKAATSNSFLLMSAGTARRFEGEPIEFVGE